MREGEGGLEELLGRENHVISCRDGSRTRSVAFFSERQLVTLGLTCVLAERIWLEMGGLLDLWQQVEGEGDIESGVGILGKRFGGVGRGKGQGGWTV